MNPANFCQRASDLIHGDRAATHGPYVRSLSNIAALWNAYLAIRREPSMSLGPTDVGIMMALLKIARTQNGEWNEDSIVDCMGYMAMVGALNDGRPKDR